MSQTTTVEKSEKSETLSPSLPPHPLASLVGAWKDMEKLKTLTERVEAYRREVEAKERAAEG
jgi:hypothetical protein